MVIFEKDQVPAQKPLPLSKAKVSPLYVLMERLVQEKSKLLSEYNIVNRENEFGRKTFYLTRKTLPGNLIELSPATGYFCVDTHLSLDRIYMSDMNAEQAFNFSIAHYTERYENEAGESYVAHIFFNYGAQFLGAQLRKWPEEACEERKMDAEWQTSLRQNAADFVEFLKKLYKEHESRLGELEKQALTINAAAVELSKSLPKNIEAFRKEFKRFSEVIEQINVLSPYRVDRRAVRMGEVLKYAEDLYNSLESSKQSVGSEVPNEGALSGSLSPKIEEAAKPEPEENYNARLEGARAKLIVEIKQLAESMAIKPSDDFDKIIEKFKKIEVLNQNILQLYCFPSASNKISQKKEKTAKDVECKTKREQMVLVSAEKNISLLYEAIYKQFESAMLELDLEAIRKIHPFIRDGYTEASNEQEMSLTSIYMNFFRTAATILNNKAGGDVIKKEALVLIGKFLLQNSKVYRDSIKIFFGIYTQPSEKSPYLLSQMGRFISENQFEIFSFFLEQGADINGVAMQSSPRAVSLLSYSIFLLREEFAFTLLQRGARLVHNIQVNEEVTFGQLSKKSDKKYSYEAMGQRADMKKIKEICGGVSSAGQKKLRSILSAPNDTIPDIEYMFERTKFPSRLYFACIRKSQVWSVAQGDSFKSNDPMMLTLLQLSDLAELVFSITHYANLEWIRINLINPENLGKGLRKSGIYCISRSEAEDFLLDGESNGVVLCLNPKNPTVNEEQGFIILRTLVEAFQKKLAISSVPEIRRVFLKLIGWFEDPSLLIKDEPLMKGNLLLSAVFLAVSLSDHFLLKNLHVDREIFTFYLKVLKYLKSKWVFCWSNQLPDVYRGLEACEKQARAKWIENISAKQEAISPASSSASCLSVGGAVSLAGLPSSSSSSSSSLSGLSSLESLVPADAAASSASGSSLLAERLSSATASLCGGERVSASSSSSSVSSQPVVVSGAGGMPEMPRLLFSAVTSSSLLSSSGESLDSSVAAPLKKKKAGGKKKQKKKKKR